MVHGEESSWRMERAALPLNQALAYGVQAHAAAVATPSCFLDFQPSAAAAAYFGFGELEEALIHGGGGASANHGGGGVDPGMIIKSDAPGQQQTKPAAAAAAAGYHLAGAGRPPTLEIFPSWPMRHQQQLHSGNSQSVGSTTDSSSAQNTMSQMELVSPASPAPGQEVMMVTTDDYSYKPGLAAAPAPPSFQQQQQHHHHHPLPLHLHGGGGGDHDKRKQGSTRKDGKLADAKTERRLAQNREAARKSRLRKKAYVQQLETSRIRLQQVEHELQRARSQGLFAGLLAIVVGELGRRRTMAVLLRLYTSLSSIAVAFSVTCIIRSELFLKVMKQNTEAITIYEIFDAIRVSLGILLQMVVIATTTRLLQNMSPPKRAS